jgi:hypothetical protein
MMRSAVLVLTLVLVSAALPFSAQEAPRTVTAEDFVSTWTLTAFDQGVSGGAPARVANPRGLLVLDRAGHAFEFVTSLANQRTVGAQMPAADAQAAFAGYGGFWGRYSIDAAKKTISYRPEGGISPGIGGKEFSRSFALDGNRLTVTAGAEPHTVSGTMWVWDRVPTIDHLSPLYREVVGFWQHVIERRVNQKTGAVISESKRAPSIIVYTPGGFVGVHFPPITRKPFAAEAPTPEEARAALAGYIGYYGVLTVYPGQVFHNILGGVSPVGGTILRRSAAIKGDELTVRLTAQGIAQGESATIVTLKRLSGADEMLPRGGTR